MLFPYPHPDPQPPDLAIWTWASCSSEGHSPASGPGPCCAFAWKHVLHPWTQRTSPTCLLCHAHSQVLETQWWPREPLSCFFKAAGLRGRWGITLAPHLGSAFWHTLCPLPGGFSRPVWRLSLGTMQALCPPCHPSQATCWLTEGGRLAGAPDCPGVPLLLASPRASWGPPSTRPGTLQQRWPQHGMRGLPRGLCQCYWSAELCSCQGAAQSVTFRHLQAGSAKLLWAGAWRRQQTVSSHPWAWLRLQLSVLSIISPSAAGWWGGSSHRLQLVAVPAMSQYMALTEQSSMGCWSYGKGRVCPEGAWKPRSFPQQQWLPELACARWQSSKELI